MRQTTACIVVPTYNESGNIVNLLDQIYSPNSKKHFKKNAIVLKVLVVDDNSPDGTAAIVRNYQAKNPNVHILIRLKKEGLGAAYIAGMQHAVSTFNPDIIFEMDADLSHSPEYIFPMLNEILKGSDFVIGSRYVKGGSIPEHWGIKRKAISRLANLYAKFVLGIKVKDCTGGFRAIRSSVLDKIDFNELNVKGYAFQISLLNSAWKNGARISEIPINFVDRTEGQSKMSLSDVLEVARVVLRIGMFNAIGNAIGQGRYQVQKRSPNTIKTEA